MSIEHIFTRELGEVGLELIRDVEDTVKNSDGFLEALGWFIDPTGDDIGARTGAINHVTKRHNAGEDFSWNSAQQIVFFKRKIWKKEELKNMPFFYGKNIIIWHFVDGKLEQREKWIDEKIDITKFMHLILCNRDNPFDETNKNYYHPVTLKVTKFSN